jgi:hypothetical protein
MHAEIFPNPIAWDAGGTDAAISQRLGAVPVANFGIIIAA